MTNLRITQVNAAIESESLAPRTTIFWDPTTGDGTVHFYCSKYFRLTGTEDYFGAPVEDGMVAISLTNLMQRMVPIETPEGIQEFPAALVAAIVKSLFNVLYNEQRAVTAVVLATGQPIIPLDP